MSIETHPLEPFIPQNMQLLLCGSFPPKINRWSMDFYYPNFMNDMWRVWGYLAFDNKNYFVDLQRKCFHKELIIRFCSQFGIGITDAARQVERLKDNASDKYLRIVTPIDIHALLGANPTCNHLVATGEHACNTLCSLLTCTPPALGEYNTIHISDRMIHIWRMPSTSRAYPKSIEWKANYYAQLFRILQTEQTSININNND